MAYARGISKSKLAYSMQITQQDSPNWDACKTMDDVTNIIKHYYNGEVIEKLKENLNDIKYVFDMSKKSRWTGKKKIKQTTVPYYQDNYGLLVSLCGLVGTPELVSAETTRQMKKNERLEYEHDIKTKDNEIQKLMYQLRQIEDKATRFESDYKVLEPINSDLQRAREELEHQKMVANNYSTKFQQANRELDQMNKEFMKHNTERDQWQIKLSACDTEIQRLKHELSNSTMEVQQFQCKLGQAEQEKAKFQEQVAEKAKLISEINSHKQEYDRLNKIPQRKDHEIASLNEGLKATSEDFQQQSQTATYFQELAKKKNEECQQLANDHAAMKINLKEKDKHIQDISLKLRTEISTKLSPEVSINNRPMNVAEEYQMVCSNQWLDAKGAIDESVKDVPEYQKLQLLCCIIEISERESKLILNEIYKCLQTQMFDPINFVMEKQTPEVVGAHCGSVDSQPNKHSTPCKEKLLPTEMSNIFGDQLKLGSDKVNLIKLIQHIHSILDNVGSSDGQLKHIWDMSKANDDMQEYLSSVIRIAWKMVIQRPPMEFKFTDEFLGEKFQEVLWNSDSVQDPVVINVFPMLYHGKSLMAKGKVLLLDPKKQNTEKVEVIGCD